MAAHDANGMVVIGSSKRPERKAADQRANERTSPSLVNLPKPDLFRGSFANHPIGIQLNFPLLYDTVKDTIGLGKLTKPRRVQPTVLHDE